MKFTKLQGAGNDFVLVEATGIEKNWQQLAIMICQRRFGVGADGLILMLPSKVADIGVRFFNADGSEAEACGNGLRCLVRYAIDRGSIDCNVDELSIETISGLRKAKLFTRTSIERKIQVDMGIPEFDVRKIPVSVETDEGRIVDINPIREYPIIINDRKLLLSFIAVGNPHAVYFQQQPVAKFPLSLIGPLVEKYKIFPKCVNFEVARVINRSLVEVRVWERGVGETLACGSGACAVAVIAQLLDYADSQVSIKMPGGILEVDWNRIGEVMLSGPAEIVFNGEWLD